MEITKKTRGPGFYKKDESEVLYAPNWVCSADYDLIVDLKDTYAYPVDGWYYYESEEAFNQDHP